jgi:hypothetical protein
VTTNHQLNAVGKRIFGDEYIGTFPVDVGIKRFTKKGKGQVIDQKPSYFIINVDGKNSQGSHWLAVYFDPRTQKFYIWDSFARGLKGLIPRFIKTIGYNYVNTNKKSDQKDHEESCGAKCISWLWCVKKYGINQSVHI